MSMMDTANRTNGMRLSGVLASCPPTPSASYSQETDPEPSEGSRHSTEEALQIAQDALGINPFKRPLGVHHVGAGRAHLRLLPLHILPRLLRGRQGKQPLNVKITGQL